MLFNFATAATESHNDSLYYDISFVSKRVKLYYYILMKIMFITVDTLKMYNHIYGYNSCDAYNINGCAVLEGSFLIY